MKTIDLLHSVSNCIDFDIFLNLMDNRFLAHSDE